MATLGVMSPSFLGNAPIKLLPFGQQPGCKQAVRQHGIGAWARLTSRSDVKNHRSGRSQRTDKAHAAFSGGAVKPRLAVAAKIFCCWWLLLALPAWAADLTFAAGMIGLLEVPPLSCAHQGRPSRYRPVVLFKQPAAVKPIGEIRAFPDPAAEGPCEPGATRLYRSRPDGRPIAESLPTVEWGHEEPGLIVVSRRGPWFKVVIAGGFAWLRIRPEMVFRSVPTLLQGAYAYATEGAGSLRLHQQAGGTGGWVDTPVKESAPLVVQVAQHVNGQLWLQVGLLPEAAAGSADRVGCSNPDEAHAFLAVGWLAFQDQARTPRVWFYSRGC
jgi:hypothetical protein